MSRLTHEQQKDRNILNRIMGKRVVRRLRKEGKIAPTPSEPNLSKAPTKDKAE